MSHSRRAFTLVELLVVVTIIVVLLSLLLPAMGKAIYQANLVSCGANQRVVANSAISYAHSNKRFYPARPSMKGAAGVRIWLTPIGLTNHRASFDFRPTLRDKLGLSINKNLQCPLIDPIDLEDSLPDESVAGNQALWFGWYYTTGVNSTASGFAGAGNRIGMDKLGDRFEARDLRTERVKTYSLLVSDWDLYRRWDDLGAQAAHPDIRKGTMWNWKAKRVQVFDSAVTLSYWQSPYTPANPERGELDNNFCYDDGSVVRRDGVKLVDDEMDVIPNTQSEDEYIGYQVPRQQ